MAALEDFKVNIKTIREKLPASSQMGIDEDFCLMDIRYDERQENFGYPCRLDGNVMIFCINGSVRMSVNLNEYEIRDGELIICTAGDIVKVSRPDASDAGSWHFVMLAMSHRFASDLRVDFKRILNEGIIPLSTPVIKLDERVQEILGDHLKLIAQVTSCKGELYKDSVRSLVSSLVSVLGNQWFAEVGNMKSRKRTGADARSNHKRLVFEQFLKLVAENYSLQRQVGFYADKLCLSPKYLSKLVKEVSGKPAPEWIDSYVMLEAKHLLKYSHMPIKEIVYRLHFPNQTVFYKYFKAHTGMTPTDYRNS